MYKSATVTTCGPYLSNNSKGRQTINTTKQMGKGEERVTREAAFEEHGEHCSLKVGPSRYERNRSQDQLQSTPETPALDVST